VSDASRVNNTPRAAAAPDAPLLAVNGLHHWFGGLHAIDGVSFSCRQGVIKAIIGPNGAGKSTLFNLVAGSFPPASGRVSFAGADVTGFPSHRIASLGITRTFQSSRLFAGMSVLENVMAGRYTRGRSGFLAGMLRLPAARRDERDARRRALEMLDHFGVADLAGADARSLPFGRQRVVEIVRALVGEPRLLLLDEPACGLNIRETERLGDLIRGIRSRGVTVIIVEHDMSLVMGISDEVVVLDRGSLVVEGTPREVQVDPRVVAIYLGDA
jgi:branched-chain amino acid transport system ATP-binding protein